MNDFSDIFWNCRKFVNKSFVNNLDFFNLIFVFDKSY